MVTGGVGRCGQVFATYLAWASTRLLYRGGTQLHLAGRGGLISVEGVRAFVRWVGNRSVIGFTVFRLFSDFIAFDLQIFTNGNFHTVQSFHLLVRLLIRRNK